MSDSPNQIDDLAAIRIAILGDDRIGIVGLVHVQREIAATLEKTNANVDALAKRMERLESEHGANIELARAVESITQRLEKIEEKFTASEEQDKATREFVTEAKLKLAAATLSKKWLIAAAGAIAAVVTGAAPVAKLAYEKFLAPRVEQHATQPAPGPAPTSR